MTDDFGVFLMTCWGAAVGGFLAYLFGYSNGFHRGNAWRKKIEELKRDE